MPSVEGSDVSVITGEVLVEEEAGALLVVV
jgi:hypothetical protein